MSKGFKNLLDSLQGSRGGQLPGTQAFPALDIEQISRELDLAGRALHRSNGPVAADEDPNELDIRQEIDNRAGNARDEYQHRLDLYDSRIREATLAGDLRVEIDASGEAALSDYKMMSINDRNHLHSLRDEVKGREDEYHEFRRQNRLSRLPRIVNGGQKTVIYLAMALLFCIESILNGLFFAKGSEAGLIGGVAQAIVLSLINMVPAFLFASYGIPLIAHRKLVLKLAGVMLALVYVAMLLGINFLIAHFREVFITHDGNVDMIILLEQIRIRPFGLGDAQSWILGVVGIGVSVFTLISATRLDDLYPGYGEIGRVRESAIANYAHSKEACLLSLEARRSNAVQDMTDVIRQLNGHGFDKELARTGRLRLNQEFGAFLDSLAETYRRLVLIYRGELARNNVTPSQLPPVLESNRLDRPTLSAIPELDDQGRSIGLQRLESYIKSINAEYARIVSEYDTAGDLVTSGSKDV